jgi:signal transduction histidine kinase
MDQTITIRQLLFGTLTLTVVFMTLTLLFFWSLHIGNKKAGEYITEMNRLKEAHEKDMMQAKLDMQEVTFRHISRELHDNIIGCLSMCKLHLTTLDMADIINAEKKTIAAVEIISKSVDDLCDLSRTLDTNFIEKLGLATVLKKELNRLSLAGVFAIESEISENIIDMGPEKEVLIYRIAQEALNNIRKHSQARNIKICLRYQSSHVDLIINDNGKGFNYSVERNGPKGAGLNNIMVRARALNGKVSIESELDKGTSVYLSIPYE